MLEDSPINNCESEQLSDTKSEKSVCKSKAIELTFGMMFVWRARLTLKLFRCRRLKHHLLQLSHCIAVLMLHSIKQPSSMLYNNSEVEGLLHEYSQSENDHHKLRRGLLRRITLWLPGLHNTPFLIYIPLAMWHSENRTHSFVSPIIWISFGEKRKENSLHLYATIKNCSC